MKLHEIVDGQPPVIASMLRKALKKGHMVKARVSIMTMSGNEKGDAEVLSVADDGWSFQIRDLIDDDADYAPLRVKFNNWADEDLILEKTPYGRLLRNRNEQLYIAV